MSDEKVVMKEFETSPVETAAAAQKAETKPDEETMKEFQTPSTESPAAAEGENKPAQDKTTTTVPISTSGPATESKKDAAVEQLSGDKPDAPVKAQEELKEDAGVATGEAEAGQEAAAAAPGLAPGPDVAPASSEPVKPKEDSAKETGETAEAGPSAPQGEESEETKADKPAGPIAGGIPPAAKAGEASADKPEGATKPADEEKPGPANGSAPDLEMEDAPEKSASAPESQPGDKRKAEEEGDGEASSVANGSGAAETRAGKKAKVLADDAPTANGGAGVARKTSKGKREKKPVAPVGKTARRTRSQGLTEG